jgi:hypothetical protein
MGLDPCKRYCPVHVRVGVYECVRVRACTHTHTHTHTLKKEQNGRESLKKKPHSGLYCQSKKEKEV